MIAAAACAIGATYVGLPWLHYVAKPAATVACLLIALQATAPRSVRYQRGVAAALVLGTIGDVLLMLPDASLFPLGLGSFLVGHLAYLWAMTDGVRLFERPAPAIYFGFVSALLLSILLRSIEPSLRGPVIGYVVVLASMAAQARVRALVRPDRGAQLAATGGTLFVLSDALLAIERFVTPFPLAQLLILVSYWGAQWSLASSVASSPTNGTDGTNGVEAAAPPAL